MKRAAPSSPSPQLVNPAHASSNSSQGSAPSVTIPLPPPAPVPPGTGSISIRSTIGSRRGSAMTAPGAYLSRILRNMFKRGRVQMLLRTSMLAVASFAAMAVLLCARPRLDVTDDAFTLRLERAEHARALRKWLWRTPSSATAPLVERNADGADGAGAADNAPPAANDAVDVPGHAPPLLAAPFTASRALVHGRRDLAVPAECAEWRAVARDPERLVLYRRHFTSLDFSDWFLFVSMFTEAWHAARHADRRRPVYVDVAANHARRWSNTYFFDRCLGWDGICAEANPGYHDELRAERHCSLIDTCVSDSARVVNFSFTAAYGGVVKDGVKDGWGVDGDMHGTRAKFKKHFRGYRQLQCTTLARELARLRVRKVDFMSLDVEGYELPVLQGLDWSRVTIDVLVVENKRREIVDFLKEKRFDRFVGILKDDIYIRQGSGYEVNTQFASWLKTILRKDNRLHPDKLAVAQTEAQTAGRR